MTPLRASWSLLVAGLVSLCAGWVYVSLEGTANSDGNDGSFITFVVALLLIAGLLICRRRPDTWTGPLLQLSSIVAFLGQARWGLGGAAGPVAGWIWLATLLVPGALALVEQEVDPRSLKVFLAGPMALSLVLGTATVLAAHGRAWANSLWWQTARQQQGHTLARALFAANTAVVIAGFGIVLATSVRTLWRADKALRRVRKPIAVPGAIWAVVMMASQIACLPGPAWALGKTAATFDVASSFLLSLAPLLSVAVFFSGVVWLELIEPRLARTSAGIALHIEPGLRDVQTYLAGALGDPSVKVVFRSPDGPGWVGLNGGAARLAEDEAERAVTVITRSGLEIGAVEYDASLTSEPDAIELAVTAAGLVIDSERLAALSKSRAEQARQLAAALVSSGEAAREQVQARLERGPLATLAAVEAALAMEGPGDDGVLERAARALQDAAAEVRQISHGLYPPELTDGGLAAALTQAAEVPSGRFPRAVEVTAFLAADGDQGARLKVAPGSLTITLSNALSDPAVLERVAVLGGSVNANTVVLPLTG